MKICTMTCHHVYNYGATLQAFALQHYLESLGHEVEIIDYRLPSHRRYDWSYIYPVGRLYNLTQKIPFLKWPVSLYRNRNYLKTWGRKKSFDKFDANYLHITENTYRTIEELRGNPPKADIYIAGSDQIWNPEYENGHMPGYYLDFGDKDIKRISYAASFGVTSLSKDQKEFIRNKLKFFSSLSVREKSGIRILSEVGLNAAHTLDPVFLLSKDEWIKELELEVDEQNYIMIYDFNHDNKQMVDYVKRLSKSENLKILSINDADKAPYADIQVNNAGPWEFLQYLLNAKYVIGTSFHATAFSILFNKKFATFPLIVLSNSSRMTDLLKSLNLEDRFTPNDINIIKKDEEWEVINDLLIKQIKSSKHYIINAIS